MSRKSDKTRKSDGAAKVSLVQRAVRMLMRQGWRRGVVGGNSAWTAAGGLALVGFLAGRALERKADVVFLEELLPGQSIRITHEAR